MPQHCFKCGATLDCGSCKGIVPIGGTKLPCALKKGAIWVHVLDDAGDNVPQMSLTFDGALEETDVTGLKVFDPLEARKGYKVALGALGPLVDKYSLPAYREATVEVLNGNITYVAFELPRLTWISMRVRNTAGAILTGVDVSIKGGGKPETAKTIAETDLQADGSFKIDKVPVGDYELSLTNVDRDLWERNLATAPVSPLTFTAHRKPETPPGGVHTVAAGDCAWTLAVRYGVPEEAIWTAGGNTVLAGKYKDKYTLLPGQKVEIPAQRVKIETRAAGLCYDFVVKEPLREVVVKFMDSGKPVKDGIMATIKMDGTSDLTVPTEVGGAIRFLARYGVNEAKIDIPEIGIENYVLLLGHLAPVESPEGVLQRLTNLGYYLNPGPGKDALETETMKKAALALAVKAIQKVNGIKAEDPSPEGAVNKETMDVLVKACGA